MAKFRDKNTGITYTVGSQLDLPEGDYEDVRGNSISVGKNSNPKEPPSTKGVSERLKAELEAEWDRQGGSALQGYPLGGNLMQNYGTPVGSGSMPSGIAGANAYTSMYGNLTNQLSSIDRKQTAAERARKKALESSLDAIDVQRDSAKQNYEDAASENYLTYLKSQKALPQQLKAGGVTGGASESSALQLEAAYGTNRNQLTRNYNQQLNQLDLAEANARAGYETDLASIAEQYGDQRENLYADYQNRINTPITESALNQGIVLLRSLGVDSQQVQRWCQQNNVSIEELSAYSAYLKAEEDKAKAEARLSASSSTSSGGLTANQQAQIAQLLYGKAVAGNDQPNIEAYGAYLGDAIGVPYTGSGSSGRTENASSGSASAAVDTAVLAELEDALDMPMDYFGNIAKSAYGVSGDIDSSSANGAKVQAIIAAVEKAKNAGLYDQAKKMVEDAGITIKNGRWQLPNKV